MGFDEATVIGGIVVHGGGAQTRCRHYHLPVDVIAIRHVCCDRYYACHLCHEEQAGHPSQPWPADRFDDDVVLCGCCGRTMSVNAYLATQDCPGCGATFNPGCKTHAALYFAVG